MYSARLGRQLKVDVGITAGKELSLRIVRLKLDQKRARGRIERAGAPHQLGRKGPPGIFRKAEVDLDARLDPGCIALRHLHVDPESAGVSDAEQLRTVAATGIDQAAD